MISSYNLRILVKIVFLSEKKFGKYFFNCFVLFHMLHCNSKLWSQSETRSSQPICVSPPRSWETWPPLPFICDPFKSHKCDHARSPRIVLLLRARDPVRGSSTPADWILLESALRPVWTFISWGVHFSLIKLRGFVGRREIGILIHVGNY